MCDENERNKERKNDMRKNVIDGMKPFIRYTQRIKESDLNEL